MVFSSTIFLFGFLPLTLAGYYLLDRRFKNYFLLLASLFFYAWGEPKVVFVMIGSILVNYFFALGIDKLQHCQADENCTGGDQKYSKWLLCLMVVFNLSLFFVYKYLDFAITNINAFTSIFGVTPIPLRNIALPIGISFFTFQSMSYVFDVYYGRGKLQKNPLNVMLYVALFPQLIAGPIVRYETVSEEITGRRESLEDFVIGIKRFIIGLGKKAILANSLAIIADHAFGYTDFSQLTVLMAWFGAICYMLQLYFDFGGYSDMAIGLGLMFGFHFEENFNYPYISRSVGEFWRRWHISLGSWFRDYLFMPLSRSEWLRRLSTITGKIWGNKARRNIMVIIPTLVTWVLTGIWHGANWTFLVFGCWYGILMSMDVALSSVSKKWRKTLHIEKETRWFHCFQVIRTLFLVLIADVIFRSESIRTAVYYLGCLFGLMGNHLVSGADMFMVRQSIFLFLIGVVFTLPVSSLFRERRNLLTKDLLTPCAIATGAAYFVIFIIAIAFTVTSTYNPFIYFNF